MFILTRFDMLYDGEFRRFGDVFSNAPSLSRKGYELNQFTNQYFVSCLRNWFNQRVHVLSHKESWSAACARSLPKLTGVPAMPTHPGMDGEHRRRNVSHHLPWFAAVARKVKRGEVVRTPLARNAVDDEWRKLEQRPHPDGDGVGTWDCDSVRESSDVRAEARSKSFTVHFGSIAELCFERGSELPEGDPHRKFKGRHVFLGDQVKDQDFQNAEFEQLGSSPPAFESARAVDALSLVEVYEQTTADATSAYTQTFMGGARGAGTPTWVRIPRH